MIKSLKHLKQPAIGGSLLSLLLVLLLLAMTLVGLNAQQRYTLHIRGQVRIFDRQHNLSQSVVQLELLHMRYRSTGVALFRVGCEQITDSVNRQLKDLQALVKDEAFQMTQLRSIMAGIDTIQRFWQSINNLPATKNPTQIEQEEEKRLDKVRADIADFGELSSLQLKDLQRREDFLLLQMRSWLVLVEILIAVILLTVSLQSALTNIRTFHVRDHGTGTF